MPDHNVVGAHIHMSTEDRAELRRKYGAEQTMMPWVTPLNGIPIYEPDAGHEEGDPDGAAGIAWLPRAGQE